MINTNKLMAENANVEVANYELDQRFINDLIERGDLVQLKKFWPYHLDAEVTWPYYLTALEHFQEPILEWMSTCWYPHRQNGDTVTVHREPYKTKSALTSSATVNFIVEKNLPLEAFKWEHINTFPKHVWTPEDRAAAASRPDILNWMDCASIKF